MAYVDKSKKAKIKAALDEALKGTGVKYSLAVRNHSTIVCTFRKGSVDFIGNFNEGIEKDIYSRHQQAAKDYLDVNVYHYKNHFSGKALEIIDRAVKALNTDNFDESDSQTDYFHCGHYTDLHVGSWNKPYELQQSATALAA